MDRTKMLPVSKAGIQNGGILLGTSGYSYSEWKLSGFYPVETRTAGMLSSYAERFSSTELNYTWYQLPRSEAIERQRIKAPPHFRFAAKLTRCLTHEVSEDMWRDQLSCYRDGIAPLVQSGQLLAVLVQLPPGFDRSASHRRYLASLLDGLKGLPTAVEFRHASWANDRVFAELERRRVTLVSVDEPALPGLFPALDIVTNPDLFYVRFHGRNSKGWGSGSMQSQFDYDYSDNELLEWIENRLEKMSLRTALGAVFFNNHVRGQAPKNAGRLRELLSERGLHAG